MRYQNVEVFNCWNESLLLTSQVNPDGDLEVIGLDHERDKAISLWTSWKSPKYREDYVMIYETLIGGDFTERSFKLPGGQHFEIEKNSERDDDLGRPDIYHVGFRGGFTGYIYSFDLYCEAETLVKVGEWLKKCLEDHEAPE